jgi:outer membrane protein assembly factor BamA
MRWSITNVLTGCDHLSWSADGAGLAFASFANGGYDIYLLSDPLTRPEIQLDQAAFLTTRREIDRRISSIVTNEQVKTTRKRYVSTRDFSRTAFEDRYFRRRMGRNQTEEVRDVKIDGKSAEGRYRVKRYSPAFSLDLLDAGAAYSQFFGFQGVTQIGVSDMLGNHQILIAANIIRRLEDSDYAAAYFYLPRRTDYIFFAFHTADFLATDLEYVRFRSFGGGIGLSQPLNRYTRIDAEMDFLNFRRNGLGYFRQRDSKKGLITRLELVNDTIVWGFTGPTNGSRYRVGIEYSPAIGGLLDYRTYTGDYRTYLRFGRDQTFAFRITGGMSQGRNATRFLLGGVDNWINGAFSNRFPADTIEDIYLSAFMTPLRGAEFYERTGRLAFLMNTELRFPLIRYFILGWPLPIGFMNIRGAIFSDIGSAWNEPGSFRFTRVVNGHRQLDDLIWGYGAGMRMDVAFFLLRFDVAWKNDLVSNSRPRYYFSFGADF